MYRRTQIGTAMIGLLGVPLPLLLLYAVSSGWHPAPLGAAILLGVGLFLFHSLTIEIDSSTLRCWFGFAVIRREYPLSEIVNATAMRNRWFYGWGIRLTPNGWMWSVSGFDAVEIELTSGKFFRLGTGEPEKLAEAIREQISG